jgi:hypothetical protein
MISSIFGISFAYVADSFNAINTINLLYKYVKKDYFFVDHQVYYGFIANCANFIYKNIIYI